MKIDRIETFLVPPRWLFCRIETDSGIVGWGEPIVEGRAEVVRTAVETLAEYLLGADPLRIADHWQVMSKGGFYRGGPVLSSAVAGLDQALWDIAGKSAGLPVSSLLGGAVRDRVRVYSWVGGDSPHELEDAVAERLQLGFTAVKMNATDKMSPIATVAELNAVVGRAEHVRNLLGPERDFAIDFHGRVNVPNAIALVRALEAVRPMFVEEPLPPELNVALPRVIDSTSIPIALGERLFSRSEFLPVLQSGVAVVQPDLSHAGGISEVTRIVALSETFGALFAPHSPLGPISLAASLQVSFSTPSFLIQEQSVGIHYHDSTEFFDVVADPTPFDFIDGYATLSTEVGLGIKVDEAAVRAADRTGHSWRNPIWRGKDGAFIEW
ncbi:galactonate dehydratase [Salinibacterium sp. G-O1]|uniref:galactonate dehydratase n=1 Tax=Salinibacterium sp. G-O1 TaxID=3046208 RepID=UPI0024BB5E3C|nr:galactonate dehydratase [Salinibacterium sp. G-O1]MDJ0336082.1 galactonate dehydratase [Salinibacterium sp. G-O1]